MERPRQPPSDGTTTKKLNRAMPILGLLLYYLGILIVSLALSDSVIFILAMVAFTLILLIGIVMRNKWLSIIGSVITISGTIIPFLYLLGIFIGLNQTVIAVGSSLIALADVMFVVTVSIWREED